MSHGLLLWLENIDRRRNQVVPIPPKVDRETLRAHQRTLTVRLSFTSPSNVIPVVQRKNEIRERSEFSCKHCVKQKER